MRDCKRCGKPVDGPRCNDCGYSEIEGALLGNARNPFHGCCEWEDRGLRCTKPGSLSPGTQGRASDGGKTSGPWYCREHIDVVRGRAQAALQDERVDPEGVRRIREAQRAIATILTGRRPNPKQWAQDIVAGAVAGTYRDSTGIGVALRVLGMPELPPSEDQVERAAIQAEGNVLPFQPSA